MSRRSASISNNRSSSSLSSSITNINTVENKTVQRLLRLINTFNHDASPRCLNKLYQSSVIENHNINTIFYLSRYIHSSLICHDETVEVYIYKVIRNILLKIVDYCFKPHEKQYGKMSGDIKYKSFACLTPEFHNAFNTMFKTVHSKQCDKSFYRYAMEFIVKIAIVLIKDQFKENRFVRTYPVVFETKQVRNDELTTTINMFLTSTEYEISMKQPFSIVRVFELPTSNNSSSNVTETQLYDANKTIENKRDSMSKNTNETLQKEIQIYIANINAFNNELEQYKRSFNRIKRIRKSLIQNLHLQEEIDKQMKTLEAYEIQRHQYDLQETELARLYSTYCIDKNTIINDAKQIEHIRSQIFITYNT